MNKYRVNYQASGVKVGRGGSISQKHIKGWVEIGSELTFEVLNTAEHEQEVGQHCVDAIKANKQYAKGFALQSVNFQIRPL